MTVLSAQEIRERQTAQVPLLTPFSERSTHEGMTYGLSSAGYDIRCKQDIVLYPVTLKNLLLNALSRWWPHLTRPSFSSEVSSIEKFNMPTDLLARVTDKSTWARRGLTVQNTVIEPGWKGWLTLELSNHGKRVIRISAGMPIAQVVFERMAVPTELPYSGRYQNQENRPVPPRVYTNGGKYVEEKH